MARTLANPPIKSLLATGPTAVVEPDIVLTGSADDDLMFGLPTDDVLSGQGGDDTIFGNAGSDYIFGDLVNATLSAADAPVDFGNDILFGLQGDDWMAGDANNLLVDYGDGDVSVATGNDLILGGSAAVSIGDVYSLDFYDGNGSASASVVLGDDVLIGTGGGMSGDAYYVYFTYIDDGAVTVHFGDDQLYGGDVLTGDATALYLTFNDFATSEVDATFDAGNDLLSGGAGDDLIYGDFNSISSIYTGDSTVVVNCGDDLIEGGTGDDLLVGDVHTSYSDRPIELNYGSDSFIFEGGFGDDWIVDFQIGLDLLVLEGFGVGFGDLDIQTDAGGMAISLEAFGGGTIYLAGVAALDADSFVFL